MPEHVLCEINRRTAQNINLANTKRILEGDPKKISRGSKRGRRDQEVVEKRSNEIKRDQTRSNEIKRE